MFSSPLAVCKTVLITLGLILSAFNPLTQAEEKTSAVARALFDGKTLSGWKGDETFWHIEDGKIVAESTEKNPCKHNTFLVWDDGLVDNFTFKLKFKISGGETANSGIQYRSQIEPDGHVVGYQADIDRALKYLAGIYDEKGRGQLALMGEVQTIDVDGKRRIAKPQEIPEAYRNIKIASREELLKAIKIDDWNEYEITAVENILMLKINGLNSCFVIDLDEKNREKAGVLALQLHSGPPMKVEFKDLTLQRLPLEGRKKIVFVAGRPSHGAMQHEHNAGCKLLAKALNESGLPIHAVTYHNGWPRDPSAFDNANSIVFFCDGGGGHYVNQHLMEVDQLMSKGVGLACIHYGVEVPKGEAGDHYLKWIGGYFETFWSVNPHWTATFDKFPDHPISRGVEPFTVNDEWYYHMRFRENMEGVTPILSALPPRETLNRGDGPHAGNPFVREDVLVKQLPQHVAWAYQRPDGGRGFGFTGAHFHKNWQIDGFRTTVLNAIAWTAGLEIPKTGVPSKTPNEEEINANLDPKGQPKKAPEQKKEKPAEKKTSSVPPLFESPVITNKTSGFSTDINVDIKGAKKLHLIVSDAGNGFTCDWADWVEPKLVGPQGETKLTDLKWSYAETQFGEVRVNANVQGHPLKVAGQNVSFGIGTHANSIITYDLPENHQFTHFKAKGALDMGGTEQGGADSISVKFIVANEKSDARSLISANAAQATSENHDVESSLNSLTVYPGLDIKVFASEPMMTNPSNIDIDHLGRVWVCEVINYRAFRNSDSKARDDGDRILVLEDTDGDSKADKSTVFYQGKLIDSAHGVCVLGNRVIVSAGDKVISFYDDNNDLKADRHEVLFSAIKGVQHDHGIHAFIFGPDGKLYFNFGNEGKQLGNYQGEIIKDKAGNLVNDSRKPYQEGMIFRCNLDGSELETLGWNFRNPWEICIDSNGTLWQSDNDDDGNRGTRINYVMPYGNYGYKDELTGNAWRVPRTNLEKEIPLQHWHLNDPGVIPNVVQTGAGSPTGMCAYEGDLLPEAFRNQIIHCDPGPNVVRAYPVKPQGAGYTGEILNLVESKTDRWFRPDDICTAPDGSVLIADWYDPSVGGHRMGDTQYGRIYRVAPPGNSYQKVKHDLKTTSGLAQALTSPNNATRYLAYTGLVEKPFSEVYAAVAPLLKHKNPRVQSRALFLLGKLKTQNSTERQQKLAIINQALEQQANTDLTIAAIRLIRQLTDEFSLQDIQDTIPLTHPDPAVRREILISMRGIDTPEYANVWIQLAVQHQPGDRWYLEALGIAADGTWDACLSTYLAAVKNDLHNPQVKEIVWRSRAKNSAELILKIIDDPQTPVEELPRYFRALDYQQLNLEKLAQVAFARQHSPQAQSIIVPETINRLGDNPGEVLKPYQSQIDQLLEKQQGSMMFVQLASKLGLEKYHTAILDFIISKYDQQDGVDAARIIVTNNLNKLIDSSLRGFADEKAEKLGIALGLTEEPRMIGIFNRMISDQTLSLTKRKVAIKGMSRTKRGLELLLEMVEKKADIQGLEQSFASAFSNAQQQEIRKAGEKYFPLTATKDAKPLPPLKELATRKGDVKNGRTVFFEQGTCFKCHVVGTMGKEVGPNLSEIGKKLSRDALYESILFPSAGISHNYESYTIQLDSGLTATGLLVSENDNEVRLKNEEGIERTIKKEEILSMKKLAVSIMPSDIQKLITEQELVDLVEYLTTLQKK